MADAPAAGGAAPVDNGRRLIGKARSALPIHSHREAILSAVANARCLIIIGETGSGKTTQLPQYLYEAGLATEKPIVVTQPRRVAAISVAQRVSEEMGVTLGQECGYQVRFDHCCSEKTKIKYVTDGCLVRECLEDPSLSSYSAVVLDEAHVRSLDTDILLGLSKHFIACPNEDDVGKKHLPKLVVMSATLEYERFSNFFDADVYCIPGRTFPVETIYCDLVTARDLTLSSSFVAKTVDIAMTVHTTRPPGDILVFLTGRAEIEKACDMLYSRSETIDYRYDVDCKDVTGLIIVPVYGTMATEQQRLIFDPAPEGCRKIVVATDIASTSLTIDGIVYVVDSGFVKQKIFNPTTGLDALQVTPISKSEADQRAGRAGRTQPGECYRVYSTEFEEKEMEPFTRPEIQRTSLTSVVLTLKSLGIRNVLDFPYLDQPEESRLLEALRQLYIFDALARDGSVTTLGKQMAQFPVSPSLSRVLLAADSFDCRDEILALVAMLSVEHIFIRPTHPEAARIAQEMKGELEEMGGDDFNTLLYIFRQAERSSGLRAWCRHHSVHYRALSSALSIRDQLKQVLERVCGPPPRSEYSPLRKRRRTRAKCHDSSDDSEDELFGPIPKETRERVLQALCAGYFCNVGRRGKGSSTFRTMDGHATLVSIHPSSALFEKDQHSEWVIYHEVLWTSRPYMHIVAPISYSWVKDLLPKLHRVDLRVLGGAEPIAETKLSAYDSITPAESTQVETSSLLQRRNNDEEIEAARVRAFERRKARQGKK